MCIPIEIPALPDMPDGLNLSITIPLPELTIPGICCLQPIPLLTKPSIPLGFGVVNPAFIQDIKVGLSEAREWLANLPPKCPRQ